MSEITQLQHHIDQRFDSLAETMSRIGTITDNNSKDVAGLTKTCEFIIKSIDDLKADIKNQDALNLADFNRLYDGVSKRVKISTVFWIVGIAVSIMGVVSTIIASHFSG